MTKYPRHPAKASYIEQITEGIDQISSVVQTNAATAEESAAASEELSSQSQMLKSLVERFRLYEGEAEAGNYQSKAFSQTEPITGGG